jgi:hypothetical protein
VQRLTVCSGTSRPGQSPSSQDIKSELSPSGRTSSGGARAGARKSRKSK